MEQGMIPGGKKMYYIKSTKMGGMSFSRKVKS